MESLGAGRGWESEANDENNVARGESCYCAIVGSGLVDVKYRRTCLILENIFKKVNQRSASKQIGKHGGK